MIPDLSFSILIEFKYLIVEKRESFDLVTVGFVLLISSQGLTLVDTWRFEKFRFFLDLLGCVDGAAQHTDQLVGRRSRLIDLFLGLQASPTPDS